MRIVNPLQYIWIIFSSFKAIKWETNSIDWGITVYNDRGKKGTAHRPTNLINRHSNWIELDWECKTGNPVNKTLYFIKPAIQQSNRQSVMSLAKPKLSDQPQIKKKRISI